MSEPDDDTLSNDDIALLCDIGTFVLTEGAESAARLHRLVAAGYIERVNPNQAPEKFQLTGNALKVLGERGAGLNEA